MARVQALHCKYLDIGRIEKGVGLSYGLSKEGTALYIWIERGKDWADWNDAVFRHLLTQKDEIEKAFGEPLTWDAKEGNRSRKLAVYMKSGGWGTPEVWPDVIEETVEKMVRFDALLRDPVREAVKAADSVNSDAG